MQALSRLYAGVIFMFYFSKISCCLESLQPYIHILTNAGDRGVGKCCKALRRKPLHYKGTSFYKIYPGKAMHGGRVLRRDGSGYEQIELGYENCDIKPQRGSLIFCFSVHTILCTLI